MSTTAFTRLVRDWLSLIGCGWCVFCCKVKQLSDMQIPYGSQRRSVRCKRCVADRVHAHYTRNGTAKLKQWQQANPEKMREYSRRYQAKRAAERAASSGGPSNA